MGPPAPDRAPQDDEDPAAGSVTNGSQHVGDGKEPTEQRRETAGTEEQTGPGEAGRADERADRGGTDSPDERARRKPDPAGSLLGEYLENPAGVVGRLPTVLTRLEADDRATRLRAATVCCLVAVEAGDEDVVEYLVTRMADRLSDGQTSIELTTALDYLAAAFPDQAEPVLAELDAADRRVLLPGAASPTRSDYFRQVGIAGSQRGERERAVRERRRHERDDETVAAGGDREQESGVTSEASGDASRPEPGVETPDLSRIARRSRFDELHVKGERHRGRYATTYEALVGEGGVRRAVALRLLHQPDPPDAVPEFDRGLAVRLRRWQSVSDHDRVVGVIDWGTESRPWVASSLIDEPLAARERPALATALENALALTDAVSHLHRHDVVHGGLDSRTVVYPGERFGDGDDRRGPLLNNVGLLTVFRHYFDPADCLDPRYAAPEYYDTRFGRIDHATDIYQLGAVCYRLFTGRPPYTGEFEAVREAVLDREPPAPSSAVDGVPAALDDLLAKALATQKLRRHETIQQFRGELATLVDEHA